MNKSVDERLIPNGEYIDALNCRMGSSEGSEIGVIENSKGNEKLTTLIYNGTSLSSSARTIGAYQDGASETIYWFVHDPSFATSPTGKLDMVVSFNAQTQVLTYHIVSIKNGVAGTNTTLNFNPEYLITGVNLVDSGSEGLLFWTDDYNQPRFINIKRSYPLPAFGLDQFTGESILVIKKPPMTAPQIQPLSTGGQQNFMEERFICFAYRYRYADGEYSATSQFTEPAFIPNQFQFTPSSYLNDGMMNIANTTIISYNTGGPLVKGIDLLFKEASSNVIKVIEKLDKEVMGIPDNTVAQYTFSNSKIFTVLPESEILRLYDNVPLLAKAQTIMGNRLVYGNYVEGYDLVDINGVPTRFTYIAELDSEEINNEELTDYTDDFTYTINGSKTITNAILSVGFTFISDSLKAGSQLNLTVRLTHSEFSGSTPEPTEITQDIEINWAFTLPVDYADVYEMATSVEFINAVGSPTNIKPVYSPNNPTSCDGFTLTDIFNCAVPNNLTGQTPVTKYASGITAINQPIQIFTSPSSTFISFAFPVMRYVEDVDNPDTFSVYEYYQVTFAEAFWSGLGVPRSLHSNRGYEVGIVYMDEYGRSSTALVSEDNTVHVPCSYCDRQNKIKVTIPTTQRAPYWAKKYKLAIKADRDGYETIYSNLFFRSPERNEAYILLEGENARKVELGDRLIVKSDSAGPAQNCTYITVLEKEAKQRGFLEIPSEFDPNVNIEVPAGVYIKVNPNSISLVQDENAFVTSSAEDTASGDGKYPIAFLNVNLKLGNTFYDYSIPAGSVIIIKFKFERKGSGDGNNECERRIYTLEKRFIASATYDNFKDWWDGDNIEGTLDSGIQQVGGSGGPINNVYITQLVQVPDLGSSGVEDVEDALDPQIGTNKYIFVRNTTNNALYLAASGTRACGTSSKRKSRVSLSVDVFRADTLLVFETEPKDTLPDIFYENNLSFDIGQNGEHYGNVQNQNFTTYAPAIVDTQFFNCFAFGNGVESYKVRDSAVGKTFNLGNRVVAVSAQDYKEADRFADLTYSGVYNDESNVNKLNEFNLGLLNFKPLEDSFGQISLIDGRQTDILVLQEDKISYVLAGKNLLSDAAGGGALSSVPEVLGTQIARIENYGNSFNPESYAKWGADKFFTDAKRGAVIQLRGDSYSNEQLQVVSEFGMRPWFRDLFIDYIDTQKLGGYDPYMTEYVLSSNTIQVPFPEDCIDCGTPISFAVIVRGSAREYCVDLSTLIGPFTVSWQVITAEPGATFVVECRYDNVLTTSGIISSSGSFTIQKNNATPISAFMKIYSESNAVSLQVTVGCPQAAILNVVEVVLSNDDDQGKYTHAEYRYVSGQYFSPITSNLVQLQPGMQNPLVSRYNIVTGYKGSGSIPVNGSTVSIISNKIGFDDFTFNPSIHKFRWLSSNTLHANTPTGMANMLAAAATLSTSGIAPVYFGNFTMPNNSNQYLYLIWDLRTITQKELCYSSLNLQSSCCGCGGCYEVCSLYRINGIVASAIIRYTDCISGVISQETLLPSEFVSSYICSRTVPQVIAGEGITITEETCGC